MNAKLEGWFKVRPDLLHLLPPVCVTSTGPASNTERGTQNEEWLRHCCSEKSSPILADVLDFLGFPTASTLGSLHANRRAKPDVMLRHTLMNGYAFTRISGKLHTEASAGKLAGNQIQRIARGSARGLGLLPLQSDLAVQADKWLLEGVSLLEPSMKGLSQWLAENWMSMVESCVFGSPLAERVCVIMAVKVRPSLDGYDRAVDMQAFTKKAFIKRLSNFGLPGVRADGRRYGNELVWFQQKSCDSGQASGDLQAMLSVPNLLAKPSLSRRC